MWEKLQLDCLEVQGASWCPPFSLSLTQEKWKKKKVCDTKTKFAIAVDWQEIHSVPLQKKKTPNSSVYYKYDGTRANPS